MRDHALLIRPHHVDLGLPGKHLVDAVLAQRAHAFALLCVDPESVDLHAALNTVPRPLNGLSEAELCPGPEVLARLNAGLR
jgi:hypothetical protein